MLHLPDLSIVPIASNSSLNMQLLQLTILSSNMNHHQAQGSATAASMFLCPNGQQLQQLLMLVFLACIDLNNPKYPMI
jgi:hypothetical protein